MARTGQMTDNVLELAFEEFKAIYPKRKGSNPWVPAQRTFEKAVKKTAPQTIIDAARVYAAEQRELGNVNTPYVCQAVTWLNQQRWKDYQGKALPTKALTWIANIDPRWRSMAGRYYAEKGKLPPHVAGLGGQGWRFPSEWLVQEYQGAGGVSPSSPKNNISAVRDQSFLSRNESDAQEVPFDG